MKTKLRQIFLFLIVLVSCRVFFVQAFEKSDFAYFKNVLENKTASGLVVLELDADVFEKSKYTDLKLLDEMGTEEDFNLLNQDLQFLSSGVKVINSSESENLKTLPKNMFDGNRQTYFEAVQGDWNEAKELYQSFLILDLGEKKDLKVIDFILPENENYWNFAKLSFSDDNLEFEPVNNFIKSDEAFYFPDLQTRYLRIDFEYKKVLAIAEISLYEKGFSKILFNYNPAKKYRLFYGNLKDIEENFYNFDLLYNSNLPILKLAEEENNPDYNQDFDADGVSNFEDNCPFEANANQKDSDQDTIGDVCDSAKFMDNKVKIDLDYDGFGQANDNCPYLKNPLQIDQNQNGVGDLCEDEDEDTILNFWDNCVWVKNYNQKDQNEDGVGDVCEGDYDADEIEQNLDNCPNLANPNQIDTDGDGLGDLCDNCPNLANPNQIDQNQNGIGDLCEDEDGDGIIDAEDNCKSLANPDQLDSDGDSRGDLCDNCPQIKNSAQWDDDGDGVGNDCDDADNDGVIGANDNCPLHANPDQMDSNLDGVGDVCEDFDGDLIVNISDNCPQVPNPDQLDSDEDGIGDLCDATLTVRKPNKLFYVITGLIALVFLYYSLLLIKQIREAKNGEKD